MKLFYQKRQTNSILEFNRFPFLHLYKKKNNKSSYLGLATDSEEYLFLKVKKLKNKTIIKIYLSCSLKSHFIFLYLFGKFFKIIYIFGIFLLIGVSLSFLFDSSWQTNGKIDYAAVINVNIKFLGAFLIFSSVGYFLLDYFISSNRKLTDQLNEIKKYTKLRKIDFIKIIFERLLHKQNYISLFDEYLNSAPIIFQT